MSLEYKLGHIDINHTKQQGVLQMKSLKSMFVRGPLMGERKLDHEKKNSINNDFLLYSLMILF